MTIIELLKNNQISTEISAVAKQENISFDVLKKGILSGEIVIPKNINRKMDRFCGVGKGLKTKINANIGTSPDSACLDDELEKLDIAVKAGADAVMDLSTGGDLTKIRETILKKCIVPLGTVPIYQVANETINSGRTLRQMDTEHMFSVIEEQAQQGVDFMTIHCGITKKTTSILKNKKRLAGVVSRGGAFLTNWIAANGKENPLFEQYDRLLDIMKKYDVTLSLGDGLRPGCLADASDEAQLAELAVLGELVLRARKADVQVIVEGPGHMPINQIQEHMILAKKLIHNAPYYVLGPLVTDVAAGYDHITSAIGGTLAASYGADFLCYVTPSEHLRLPNSEDVYNGVIASKIAAHAGDIAKNVPGAVEWDNEFSKYRKALDWKQQEKLALDPVKFKKEREKLLPKDSSVCTMCGEYCAMKPEHEAVPVK